MKEIHRIGFIGVGVMGEPICRHLATKSHVEVLACDQNREPLERLDKVGVKTSSSTEIAQTADLIFLSLPSGAVVEKVVLADGGLLSQARGEQILIDLSTSPYQTALRLGEALAARNICFADAPVMRTRTAAEDGTLAVPVGAEEAVFQEIEPFIRMFAIDVLHAGPVGSGQLIKILNNMVVYETVLALAEARAIGVRVGMDPDKLFAALATGSADSFALRNQGMKAVAPQNFPERAFPITYARKDLSYALELAEQVGVNATGAKNLVDCFDQAIRLGWGDKYAPAISLVFEQAAKPTAAG